MPVEVEGCIPWMSVTSIVAYVVLGYIYLIKSLFYRQVPWLFQGWPRFILIGISPVEAEKVVLPVDGNDQSYFHNTEHIGYD